jgi:hypothetical protein
MQQTERLLQKKYAVLHKLNSQVSLVKLVQKKKKLNLTLALLSKLHLKMSLRKLEILKE